MAVPASMRDLLDRLASRHPDLDPETARTRGRAFIVDTAIPALDTVRAELAAGGYPGEVVGDSEQLEASLIVPRASGAPFTVVVRAAIYHKVRFAFPAFHGHQWRPRHLRIEIHTPTRTRTLAPDRLDRAALAALCRESARKWLSW